ncbi:MAG: ABC transporter permease [Elusimicrobia bacterium]|nr:ABC transporter permease [Elusimicrobiota bacterium]
MNIFSKAGAALLYAFGELGSAALMIRSAFFWAFHSKIEWRQSLIQCMRVGVDSLPVTTLTSFFTGMVLALQTGSTSQNIFNEPIFVGTIVGFSLVKELGPVLTAIVVAGRAGAAMAAELGTMKVTEQIDALHVLGTDPVRYLVIPRYIACMVMIPVLTVYAMFSGIFGGFIVSASKLHVPTNTYWDDILNYMQISDFMHGFSKSFIFAFMIATVCCYRGLSTTGGAEGVGKTTTRAVVVSMVLVLVLDYFSTAVLVALGV